MSPITQEINLTQISDLTTSLRIQIIKTITAAGSGHPGSSLSCIDIMIALFFGLSCGTDREQNRFVLSKGHAEAALYSIYHRLGWISEEELYTMRRLGSRLQGHPDPVWLDYVEFAGGSLGQGLSFTQGLAAGLGKSVNVYTLLGDGELQEGQLWEAALSIPRMNLTNIKAIVDWNRLQLSGPTPEYPDISHFLKIFENLGWACSSCDGHDVLELYQLLSEPTTKPHIIFAKTIKGKGISFMENNNDFHGRGLSSCESQDALKELMAGNI